MNSCTLEKASIRGFLQRAASDQALILNSLMKHVFLAFTNPVDGMETAFNSWYDSNHVPEVLRYGRGFIGCRRFKLQREVHRGATPPWSYLALYHLDDTDLSALAASPWAEPNPPLTPFRGILQSDH